MENINKFELTGFLDETPKIHEGQYNNFGNFIIRFPCIKKGEWGTIRGATFHDTAIEKLRTAEEGDGIKIVGRLNEDHYEYMKKPVKTKKLQVEELWIMKGAADMVDASTQEPKPEPPKAKQAPPPAAAGSPGATTPAQQPVTTDDPGAGPPPHSESDMPPDGQSGGQWT